MRESHSNNSAFSIYVFIFTPFTRLPWRRHVETSNNLTFIQPPLPCARIPFHFVTIFYYFTWQKMNEFVMFRALYRLKIRQVDIDVCVRNELSFKIN